MYQQCVNEMETDLVDMLNENETGISEVDDNILSITGTSSNYYSIDDLNEALKDNNRQNNLSVLHINIQSLSSKFHKLKIMLSTLSEVNVTFDIICICETFLNCHNNSLFSLPGYTFVNKFRKESKGGGVGIYIKTNLNFKTRDDLSLFEEKLFESIFIEVSTQGKPIVVGEIYRSPFSSKTLSIQKYEHIFALLSKENKDIIIGTDQNIDLLDRTNRYGTHLINSAYASGIIPTISKPTRITSNSASLIDNIYVSCPKARDFKAGILSYDLSDHLPVFAIFKKKNDTKRIPTEFEYRNLNKSALLNLKNLLEKTDWFSILTGDINNKYDKLIEQLNEYIDMCAPLVKVKINSRLIKKERWMTKGLIQSSLSLSKLFKLAKSNANNENIMNDYKLRRNLFNKLIRRVKREFYENLFDKYKGDLSNTWKTYSTLMNKSNHEGICSEFRVDDKPLTDPKSIANEFCKYFTEIGKHLAENIPNSKCHFSEYLSNKQVKSFYLKKRSCSDQYENC